MKKRLVALMMVGMLSVSMLAGCGKDASDEKDNVRTEEDADTKDTEQGEGSSLSIDTKDFDKMMDAYKDYYSEFCEENLKPYYEDHSDCDCAARFVVNPDDNNIMMVIADIVDAAGDEMKVDLYFYEYKSGKVKEYLSIPGIWTTTDGIYVGNIVDGLFVSTTTYPNGGQYEHTQYRIADGKAEEITQSKEDDEEWIDINTEKGVFEYPLPYDLSGRIFTDCDSYANKYCVAERNLEEAIDFIKAGAPKTSNELKVLWVDYLVDNRITSKPDISADAFDYEDIISQIEMLEEKQIEFEDVRTLNSVMKAVEMYVDDNPLPSNITEITVEFRDGKVYADSSVDISEYMGLSSASEGVSLESEEWKPFTLTYSLSTGEWTLSPENTGALYYDALGNRLKDNSSEENNTDNGGAAVGASEGREPAPADSGDTTASSSSADDEILQKYEDYIENNDVDHYDVSYGCKFVDIDEDGTPELITDYGAQFQNLLYIDGAGEVSALWGIRYYDTDGAWIVLGDETGGLQFATLTGGFYSAYERLEVELDYDSDGGIMDRYYYGFPREGTREEISYEKAQEIYKGCENNYVSVSLSDAPSEITLEDAWEAYNN